MADYVGGKHCQTHGSHPHYRTIRSYLPCPDYRFAGVVEYGRARFERRDGETAFAGSNGHISQPFELHGLDSNVDFGLLFWTWGRYHYTAQSELKKRACCWLGNGMWLSLCYGAFRSSVETDCRGFLGSFSSKGPGLPTARPLQRHCMISRKGQKPIHQLY